ncbi:hypothetical protein [Pseudomonas sp. dw_358]|uniref:hypothetical protein n=1 Tax=Pseudomonas sp. dw_358 TaxID=2720083 RepID=UPI001BD65CF2|nr:hypothetical protein [Pseudomonas sp. dw_358]
MGITVDVSGQTKAQLRETLKKIQARVRDRAVFIGIPAGSGEQDGMTIARLGAIHEFGATIDHPGGTQYGYTTEDDAHDGKVRFQSTGKGVMALGITGPHQIIIPERSFLRAPLRAHTEDIKKAWRAIIPKVIKGELTLLNGLHQIGARASAFCRDAIKDGIAPANAASTIRKKGSSTPLIDQGILVSKITYRVEG